MAKKKKSVPKKRSAKNASTRKTVIANDGGYGEILDSVVELLQSARRLSARALNSVMTATYWEIGRRIVEWEQGGKDRAEYGDRLLKLLAKELTATFGRGFSRANLEYMRRVYVGWPISQTLSGKFGDSGNGEKSQTPSGKSGQNEDALTMSAHAVQCAAGDVTHIQILAQQFPLTWSHYIQLLSVEDANARHFWFF